MIQIEISYDQFNDKRGGRLNFNVKSESQDPPEVENLACYLNTGMWSKEWKRKKRDDSASI